MLNIKLPQKSLIAVSGGIDSMVLLHVLSKNDSVFAAHYNHNLRGDESKADAELVKRVCRKLNIPLVIETAPINSIENDSIGSIEESARNARFKFLERAAKFFGVNSIVTAHHTSDQVETILHNMIRGTGVKGFAGMQHQRYFNSLKILKPFLSITKDQIRKYALDNNIEYNDDSSNFSTVYTRNKIRCEIMPLLKGLNPKFEEAIVRLSTQCADMLAVVESLVNGLLETAIGNSFNTSDITRYDPVVVKQAIIKLFDVNGWPRKKLSSRHLDRIVESVGSNVSTDLPGFVRCVSNIKTIRFYRTTITRMDT